MTYYVLTASNWLTDGIVGLSDLFKAWGERRAAKALIRKTRTELSQLTDHELRDLGIGRSDIESIARGTFHKETTLQTNSNLKGWV
jgi:uncharacterized protein YjiS (DUF1127 family)